MKHLSILTVFVCAVAAAMGASVKAVEKPSALVVSDSDIMQRLSAEAERLIKVGKTVRQSELMTQTRRASCQAKVARLGAGRWTPTQLVAGCADGVLVLAGPYKCGKCARWHSNVSGGYVIDPSGIAVTCHHVIASTNAVTTVAMTRGGQVVAVREVLAASAVNDLAIIQLDGQGFTPLPLSTDAPAGTPICAISHPDHNFYSLTSGLVSRYARLRRPAGLATVMEITADFAKGSSGCPVFNETGAVVGTISNTRSVYYDAHDGHKDNLQMVFKRCTPTAALLELIRP